MIRKNALRLEEAHHDKNAKFYSLRRKTDYIWEVPEELFLVRKKYFSEGSTVIDMGCGPAISIKNILGRKILDKFTYVGIDISKKMLMFAKQNIPYGRFIHGDIEKPPLPAKYADIILSLGALHHSLDKNKTLKHWTKILKPHGFLLLREPTFESLKKGQGESPMEEGIKFHELKRFLRENKYKIVSVTFFSSEAFHLFNRILITCRLGSWQQVKVLWYPVVLAEVALGKVFSHRFRFFRGLAFTLIAQKV
jgi:ubiquinone/menaquinone biosynthesis C-methylase UbiE